MRARTTSTAPGAPPAGALPTALTCTSAVTWKTGTAPTSASTTTAPSGRTATTGRPKSISIREHFICSPASRRMACAAARQSSRRTAPWGPSAPTATAASPPATGSAWTARSMSARRACPTWCSAMSGCRPVTARSARLSSPPTSAPPWASPSSSSMPPMRRGAR